MAFSYETKQQALQRAGYKCEKCGKSLTMASAEAHHKTSVAAGGSDSLSNCQILCHDCHVGTTTTYGKH
jgi:5-methylcytosine-specific restriction enzyme A